MFYLHWDAPAAAAPLRHPSNPSNLCLGAKLCAFSDRGEDWTNNGSEQGYVNYIERQDKI